MSKAMRRLIMVSTGLTVGIAGAILMVILLMVIGNWLLRSPLDAADPSNWLFWGTSISIGVGSLAGGIYLGQWRWKLNLKEGKPFETAIVRISIMGALIGSGIAILWFELGQVGGALMILAIHGSLGD